MVENNKDNDQNDNETESKYAMSERKMSYIEQSIVSEDDLESVVSKPEKKQFEIKDFNLIDDYIN